MLESKIKAITNVKPRKGDKGVTYYFSIELEDGEKGNIGKAKEDALKVGQLFKYTMEENKDGKLVMKEYKEPRPNSYGGTPRDHKKDAVSFALSYAKDLCVAGKVEEKRMLPTADLLLQRMCDRYDGKLPEQDK